MLIAKFLLLGGAMLGALAAYALAGYSITPVRAVTSAIGLTLVVGLAVNLAAHAGFLTTPVARLLLAGFGAVFATMVALSRVVLAPLTNRRYAVAVLYSTLAFLGCGSAVFVAVKLLP